METFIRCPQPFSGQTQTTNITQITLWSAAAASQGHGPREAEGHIIKDPRIQTFATVLRRGRWRHGDVHKRQQSFTGGRR